MAQFSQSDINEAKRRVMDMQNRASRFAGANNFNSQKSEEQPESEPRQGSGTAKASEKSSTHNSADGGGNRSFLNEIDSILNGDGDNSFIIILALIMILSREGADNKLILALLYLLL